MQHAALTHQKQASTCIQFGTHLMLDGYHGYREYLDSEPLLRALLNELVVALKMHMISEPVVSRVGPNNKKDPGGLSAFVMIAESHISIHTFPNRGFVSADIYTCSNELDEVLVKERLTHAFDLTLTDVQVVKRGVRYPVENIY